MRDWKGVVSVVIVMLGTIALTMAIVGESFAATLQVTVEELAQHGKYYHITGVTENLGDRDAARTLTASIYDENDTLIGTAATVTRVAAGRKTAFELNVKVVGHARVARYELDVLGGINDNNIVREKLKDVRTAP